MALDGDRTHPGAVDGHRLACIAHQATGDAVGPAAVVVDGSRATAAVAGVADGGPPAGITHQTSDIAVTVDVAARSHAIEGQTAFGITHQAADGLPRAFDIAGGVGIRHRGPTGSANQAADVRAITVASRRSLDVARRE